MIVGRLIKRELVGLPTIQDGRFVFAEGWLEPCLHPLLKTEWFASENNLVLVVSREEGCAAKLRSELTTSRSSLVVHLESLRERSIDFTSVEFSRRESFVALRVATGPVGTLPVYFTETQHEFFLDWDYDRLAARLFALSIDTQVLVRRLCKYQPYGPRTLFTQIGMLTERSYVDLIPEGAMLTVSAPHGWVRRIANAFQSEAETWLLDAARRSLGRNGPKRPRLGVELSGGLDSAVAAILLREVTPEPIFTAGLLTSFDLQHREDQSRRRAAVVKAINSIDYSISIADVIGSPLSDPPTSDEYYETYHQGFSVLWNTFRDQGVKEVYTGFGGDELGSAENSNVDTSLSDLWTKTTSVLTEHGKSAFYASLLGSPQTTVIPSTTLTSLALRAIPYFRRGIVQTAPFASPLIVGLVNVLPRPMINDRDFLRGYVGRKIESGMFSMGYHKENFNDAGDVMLRVNRGLLKTIIARSILVDLGIVSSSVMQGVYMDFFRTRSEIARFLLLNFLSLERYLSLYQRQLRP